MTSSFFVKFAKKKSILSAEFEFFAEKKRERDHNRLHSNFIEKSSDRMSSILCLDDVIDITH